MAELTHDNTVKYLQTDKGKLQYHEAGSGPVLLLIHGSGPGVTGWANFQGNLPLFSKHFRCLILNLPGYAGSDPVAGHPVMEAVAAVIRFLDGMHVQRCCILGNSLGGMVGSHVAAKHPDRVEKLIAIGGIGQAIFSSFPAEGINLLVDFVEDPTRERLISWLRSMVYDQNMVTEELIADRLARATTPEALATMKQMYSRAGIAAIAAAAKNPDLPAPSAHFTAIKAPTLLTWGRDDRVSPVDMALLPMRMIPNCEVHIFPNCGHWVMIERKAEFESAALAFLTRKD